MMKMRGTWLVGIIAVSASAAGACLIPGCGSEADGTATNVFPNGQGGDSGSFGGNGGSGGYGKDASVDSTISTDSGKADSGPDLCGDKDPSCAAGSAGPSTGSAFPMPNDKPKPGNVSADGVAKDSNGYIVLDSTQAEFDYMWVADDMDYSVGLVSKISTKAFPTTPTYREVARYVSFTCMSDVTNGSNESLVLGKDAAKALCADGVHGCCSRSEAAAGANGGHQAINVYANRPSRTAVDFNGDVWVANRAFSRQSSVTKIANSAADCIDRNANGKIDTSSDLNNDGIITTDCNDDNLPDDGATVCAAGKSHEFYGLDDECVLFTTNTGNKIDLYGRPLALGPGDSSLRSYGPSDAWAGTWVDGTFYRVDGKTGKIKTTVVIKPQNGVNANPYGAAIDRYGILWAPNEGHHELFYFDTNDPILLRYKRPYETRHGRGSEHGHRFLRDCYRRLHHAVGRRWSQHADSAGLARWSR